VELRRPTKLKPQGYRVIRGRYTYGSGVIAAVICGPRLSTSWNVVVRKILVSRGELEYHEINTLRW
jgi:hypothetical protein